MTNYVVRALELLWAAGIVQVSAGTLGMVMRVGALDDREAQELIRPLRHLEWKPSVSSGWIVRRT